MLGLIAGVTSARAQSQTGEIFGKVTDQSGAVLPGVTVEASSPALIERVMNLGADPRRLFAASACVGALANDALPEKPVRADVAMLPVGGYYTMNVPEAAGLARAIAPRLAVPMHFGSSPALTGTAEQFRAELKKRKWPAKPLVKSNETVSCEVYLNLGPLGTEYRCLVTATFCQK